jgi:flagellin
MLPSHITEDVMASSSILTNVAALQATRQLGITSAGMKKTIERLTTGKKINHASDDATGLSNANKYDSEARTAYELRKGENQTYYAEAAKDGYLDEATNLTQRLVELAAGGNSTSAEFTSTASLAIAAALKGGATVTITDGSTASTALTNIDTTRGTIAANMAKAQSNANLYGIEYENKTAQKGNLMDADVSEEVVNLTKYQILNQAGTYALSSANSNSQQVLSLLQ